MGLPRRGLLAVPIIENNRERCREKVTFVFPGAPDEVIRNFGSIGGGAAGGEIDRYDRSLGSPPHAIILALSENHDAEMVRTKEEFLSTVLSFKNPKIQADMVLFETENTGAVFASCSELM